MKSILRTTTFSLILFFTITLATAQTPQDIAKDARVSTVSLMMDNNSYGSGFFVTPDHIATCYHVIEGAKSGHVSPVLQKEKFDIVGIVAADKKNDLVILKVFGVVGKPLPIGDSKAVDVLDRVIVVGNPAGIDGTVTTDTINNILPRREYFLMSAPVSPGSSGGTVLNEKGEVIGVTMGTIPGDKNQNQNLNLAVPSNSLTPLVEEAKKSDLLKPLSTDGITGYRLTWEDDSYEFSLHNQLRETVQVRRCMVIFYDKNDELICVDIFEPFTRLSPGSAKRIKRYSLTSLLGGIHYSSSPETVTILKDTHMLLNPSSFKRLVKRTEVRILDLNIVPNYYSPMNHKSEKRVTGGKFDWSEKPDARDSPSYVFSLHNSLDKTVENVRGLIIFYDDKKVPIDSDSFDTSFPDVNIPPGQTVLISGRVVSDSVRQLTEYVEIKILDFMTVE